MQKKKIPLWIEIDLRKKRSWSVLIIVAYLAMCSVRDAVIIFLASIKRNFGKRIRLIHVELMTSAPETLKPFLAELVLPSADNTSRFFREGPSAIRASFSYQFNKNVMNILIELRVLSGLIPRKLHPGEEHTVSVWEGEEDALAPI